MKTALRFAIGIAVFAACGALSKLLPAGRQPALKAFLIAAAFLLILLPGGKLPDFGFRAPHNARWMKVLLPGLAAGAAASLIALLFGLTGMAAMMKGYSFPQIILIIWFWSSLSEEIYCRGWFQSGLPPGPERHLWSAALFGAMHISLLFAGVDIPTVVLIVSSTTLLGWLCARVRDEYDSWIPAFVRHAGFNIGGVIGGIVYTIGYRLATGHLPTPP